MYTQVEITRIDNTDQRVVWLPVPENTVRVGDRIHVRLYPDNYQPWNITQVCVTLKCPIPQSANVAGGFILRDDKRPLMHMEIY